MKMKPKQILLVITSLLMLLAALPMLLWCWGLVNNAAHGNDYAGLGCFVAGIIYVFSMVTAIAGLVFAGRLHRYGWCRALAYIQLSVGVVLIVPLHIYTVLTLPPLFLMTILYLFGVGWRQKRDGQEQ